MISNMEISANAEDQVGVAEDEKNFAEKEFWKRKRRRWRENAKNAKSAFPTKEEYLQSDLYARRREREDTKQRWRALPLDQMKLYPPEIVIDLDYDSVMPDKVRERFHS